MDTSWGVARTLAHPGPSDQIRNTTDASGPTTVQAPECGDKAPWLYSFLNKEQACATEGGLLPGAWWGGACVSRMAERLMQGRERAALFQYTGQSRCGDRCPGSVL